MSFFSCHKPLLLNACVVMSFLTTGCTAIEETVRGSVIMAKEKMGMQTAMAAPAPAPRAAQSTEAMLDAEIHECVAWHGRTCNRLRRRSVR